MTMEVIMGKDKLKKLIEKYDQQADKAYQNYQATGVTRYDTARRNAEDMADALRQAMNAEDDHSQLVTLRCSISEWAGTIQRLNAMSDEDRTAETDRLFDSIRAVARMHGLCRED